MLNLNGPGFGTPAARLRCFHWVITQSLLISCWFGSLCFTQSLGAALPGRGRNGRQVELCVADEDLWAALPEEEQCVLQVVISAKRLEEGLGLASGQLPQSLVNGKELILVLVRCPRTLGVRFHRQ